MANNKVLKATIWYTISNFMLKGVSIITTPIFTRVLTKAEYGSYTNLVSWYSLISIIATLSLVSTMVSARFDFKDDINSYIKTNLIFGSSVAFIISGILWINRGFFW